MLKPKRCLKFEFKDQRDSNNPSYYNAEEASVIVQYLEKIMTINQHGIEKVLKSLEQN